MRALHRTLILTLACGIPCTALPQDAAGTAAPDSGPDLSTPETRRQHVLEAAVAFADSLDRISSQRIAGGELGQALKIKEHADLVRLGLHLPMEISRVDGLAVDADLEGALADFLEARSRAIEACDAARQRATEQGEVFLIQQLTAEANSLRADAAADLGIWDSDPDTWGEMRAGQAIHRVPQVFPLDSSRVPDELNVRFGPQRFLINGRSRHDTFRFQGRTVGHMGKIGIIDRQLTEDEPVLQGVIRCGHPTGDDGTGYIMAFVQGNRVVDSAGFTPVVDQRYDWKAELKDRDVNFTMTDGSRVLLNRSVPAATLTRIAFTAKVRRPPQEASLYVAWK